MLLLTELNDESAKYENNKKDAAAPFKTCNAVKVFGPVNASLPAEQQSVAKR